MNNLGTIPLPASQGEGVGPVSFHPQEGGQQWIGRVLTISGSSATIARMSATSTFTPNLAVYTTASVPNYNLAAAFSVVLALATFVLSFVFLKATQRKVSQ